MVKASVMTEINYCSFVVSFCKVIFLTQVLIINLTKLIRAVIYHILIMLLEYSVN